MAEEVFCKLVRDNVPEIIAQSGRKAVTRQLPDAEFELELHRKLMEEAQEYLLDGNQEELADIMEVILAILATKGLSFAQLEEMRLRKRAANGGFDKRIFLDRVTTA